MRRRSIVIAYDITSNKRRRQVFRCLQSWSLDGQYSLFECNMNANEAEELFLQLTNLLDAYEDTLLLAWLEQTRRAEALTRHACLYENLGGKGLLLG